MGGVDAGVEAVQAAATGSGVDGVAAQAELGQLSAGDQSELIPRQSSDSLLQRGPVGDFVTPGVTF